MRSGPVKPDDINPPNLSEVTLVAVTSVALTATVAALEKSMRQARFGKVIMLSDRSRPECCDPVIEWRSIEPLLSRSDYSRFMLRSLADHIATSHALCVQWDGFVLNGSAWDPSFLDYDYIGAVWPHFARHNVGNGGFSLRSHRLLASCAKLPFDGVEAEDVVISRLCRPFLEEHGIRFAPEAVACSFAYERTKPTGGEFGFHGAFNLVRHLRPNDALRIFRNLEPGMLARNERLELLRWALLRGHLRFAANMLARLA